MKHEFTVIVRAPKKHSRADVRGALVDALGDETPLLILGDYFNVNNYEGFGLAVKKEASLKSANKRKSATPGRMNLPPNLPPSIEAIIRTAVIKQEHWIDTVTAVAHEACRLQREADMDEAERGEFMLRRSPLVVLQP